MENYLEVEALESIQASLPFLIFKPSCCEIFNATLRPEGEKWSTIRFEISTDSGKARVKEFFLDWFYQGFPKNLMNSFVSSYSRVYAATGPGYVYFVGKDYKDMHASSAFILGTEVEIEAESRKVVEDVSKTLVPVMKMDKFKNIRFCDRSFFARGGKPDWFEERRIASLNWTPLSEPSGWDRFKPDSVGTLTELGNIVQRISIFSEDFTRRTIWIDSARKDLAGKDNYYILRRDGNFYDAFYEIGGLLAFKQPYGPAMFQAFIDNNIVTISFSPPTDLYEIRKLISEILNEGKNLFLF
ncbi:MAG: hypothetical protein QW062_05565 [Thermoplasmatales archaeon]